MTDSKKPTPDQKATEEPPLLRRARIGLRMRELKRAGKWDLATYEQFRREWADTCGEHEGDILQGFEYNHPDHVKAEGWGGPLWDDEP